MWLCHTCGELGRGGYRAVVSALEDHLRTSGHASGSYSYGGVSADRETVQVVLDAGETRHQWRDERAAQGAA